jgi:DNA (cytosine-5)-methyltransferase 1
MAISDLRSLRQTNKIKQSDLAAMLGITMNELMRYERGFDDIPANIEDNIKKIDKSFFSDKFDILTRNCGEGYVTANNVNPSIIGRSTDIVRNKHCVMDLFCGVGGFSHGFEKTGAFQITTGVDLLDDRLSTFVSNHPSATAYGRDIRNLSIAEISQDSPRPYVIIGGPPCQGFSSLRPFRNVDWNDPRNNLGEEFVRIVAGLQPEWVVFENVVGLLTHGRGRILDSIMGAFEEIGYRTSVRVLNGAHFGLPQKRERLILIGNRRGKAVDWPTPTHNFEQKSMAGRSKFLLDTVVGGGLFGQSLRDAITFNEATSDLPELAAGENSTVYRTDFQPTDYQNMMRLGANELKMHDATRHSVKMLEIIRHAGANIHALPPGMVTSGFSSCYSRLDAHEPSNTITVNFVHPASNRCIHPTQDRALTPREGARLQSFEDNFNFIGTRSQIVKQIGNAVPPIIGRVIADTILRSD